MPCPLPPSSGLPRAAARREASVVWLLAIRPRTRCQASVVFRRPSRHDANLKNLTGINATPQDLTLDELTNTDIYENGYQTKISSFDAYLERANALNQKLLIEIKTSKKDSPQMMDHFLEKYGATIKKYGHQMQSLDYHVIDKVLTYDSEIPVYFYSDRKSVV